jgi:hypothetical protein
MRPGKIFLNSQKFPVAISKKTIDKYPKLWYTKYNEREGIEMKKTYVIGDTAYSCKIAPYFNLVEVTMYEKTLTFPYRKKIGFRTFDIDAFASIDLGVVHCLQKTIAEMEKENRNYKKWKNFEKSLDNPYIV